MASTTLGPYHVGEVPPTLTVTFKDSTGAAISLTGYTAQFSYRAYGGAWVTRTATVDADQVNNKGQTHYAWVAGDFLAAGDYVGEMWVMSGAGTYDSIRFAWQTLPSYLGGGGAQPVLPPDGHVNNLAVDGAATFSGAMILPAGSIADAALSSKVVFTDTPQTVTGAKRSTQLIVLDKLPGAPSVSTPTDVSTGKVWDAGGGFHNVKSYGWIGDGASHPLSTRYATLAAAQADYPLATALTQEIDFCAFQTAVNAAQSTTSPGVVWVVGVGVVDTIPTWNLTVVIMGPGTLKQKAGANLSQMLTTFNPNAARSMVLDITIDGNSGNNASGGIGIDIEGPADVLIYGVTVKNLRSHGMFVGSNVAVDSCVADTVLGKGFATAGGAVNVRFHKPTVKNMASGQQGVALSGPDSMVTEGNFSGFHVGAQCIQAVPGADRALISSNKLITADDGIQILADDCQVIGNEITGDGVGTGGQGIAIISAAKNCIVALNKIKGLASGTLSPLIGINIDLVNAGQQRGHVVIGNSCTKCSAHGLGIGGATGSSRRMTFADNMSLDNAGYGFFLTAGDIDGVIFHDNQLFGNTSGPFFDTGTATNVVMRNNPGLNPRGAMTPPAWPASGVLFSNPFRYDMTVYVSGGTLTAIGLGGVPVPVNAAFVDASTGGTLNASTTYYYRVSALNAAGETLASTETSIATGGGGNTHAVTVKWAAVAGATGYNVYGRSTGAELKIASNVQDLAFIDTGSVTPSGALPGADTTGNTPTGIAAAAPAGAVHTLRIPALSAIKSTHTVAPTATWFAD